MGFSSRFTDALAFAATYHDGHVRKGTRAPLIAHVLRVTARVLEHAGTEDSAIVALLHETDEAADDVRAEIRRRFGARTLEAIDVCAGAGLPPGETWLATKGTYLEALRKAPPEWCLVVAADELEHARAWLADHRVEGAAVWARHPAGRDALAWYTGALARKLAGRAPARLLQELDETAGILVALS